MNCIDGLAGTGGFFFSGKPTGCGPIAATAPTGGCGGGLGFSNRFSIEFTVFDGESHDPIDGSHDPTLGADDCIDEG